MIFCGFPVFSTLYQNFTRMSPEFTGISPEFHQNFESKHIKKWDKHNSAFPQLSLPTEKKTHRNVRLKKHRKRGWRAYIYIYIYIYTHIHIYTYIYIYVAGLQGEDWRRRCRERSGTHCVSWPYPQRKGAADAGAIT